jgi:hypothetical protein
MKKIEGKKQTILIIIARRLITKGGLTDAKIINLVQSKLGHTITQKELDKLILIKPVSILFDDLIIQTKTYEQIINSSVYNALVRSKLIEYLGGSSTRIAGVYI